MNYKSMEITLKEGAGVYIAKRLNWPSGKILHWDTLVNAMFIRANGDWSMYYPSLEDCNSEDWVTAQDRFAD